MLEMPESTVKTYFSRSLPLLRRELTSSKRFLLQRAFIMQEESKNVCPIVWAETLGVFSLFTSHPLLPEGPGVRGAARYCNVSFFVVVS